MENRDKQQYGIVSYNGINLVIMQSPYLDDNCYRASAVSESSFDEGEENGEYEIFWDIANGDVEDESDACEWEQFSVKKI